MRLVILAYGLGVAALAGMIATADPAAAAKTKLGCERGKQVWNASAGKCVPGKYTRAASKAPKKARKAAKMAPAKKKKAPAKN